MLSSPFPRNLETPAISVASSFLLLEFFSSCFRDVQQSDRGIEENVSCIIVSYIFVILVFFVNSLLFHILVTSHHSKCLRSESNSSLYVFFVAAICVY